jgi:[CysO sulfur-carrier protein]-S-L-cysteine hydrolase
MSGSLPRAVLDDIYAHAKSGYPEEVCGLIVANEEVRRCENRQNALHAEDPATFTRDARTAYNLGPKDLLFLDKSLRSPRPVTIIYHSHVNVGSYFSEEDVRAATLDGELLYPVDYLVIDAAAPDRVGGCKIFRFVDGAFQEIASYGP